MQEFELGLAAASDIAYFAMQDSDDFDVAASGVLTGLNSQDQCEIQTPYYTASGSLVYGAHLQADAGTPGNVKFVAGNSAGALCGIISRGNGPVDIKPISSEAIPDGNGQVLVLTFQTLHQPLTDVTV